jgi:hypothetical protein
MIEYPALAGVFFAGDVDARLLVQPPVGESEVIRDLSGLFQDDSVGLNTASTSRVTRAAS